MFDLNSLLLFSETPKKLVDFYRQVLAREPKWQEGEYSGFEAGACTLIIGPHSKVHGQNKNPERIKFVTVFKLAIRRSSHLPSLYWKPKA